MADIVPAAAKQLSPEEVQALTDRAYDLETNIKTTYGHVHAAWWDCSRYLFEFQQAGCWALLGYDRLEDWLAQPDLGMSRAQYFLMVNLWRDLVVTRQVPPARLADIEPTKVREVTPAIMRGEVTVDDALDDAKALGYRDVKEKYRRDRQHGQAPDDSTPLDAGAEPVLAQCGRCGSWVPADKLDDAT